MAPLPSGQEVLEAMEAGDVPVLVELLGRWKKGSLSAAISGLPKGRDLLRPVHGDRIVFDVLADAWSFRSG